MIRKEKQIQIPRKLFDLMEGYIHDHYDKEDVCRYRAIRTGIEQKHDALLRHAVYSIYKTSADPRLREEARQHYLDLAGMADSFRWDGAGNDAGVLDKDACAGDDPEDCHG